MCNTVSNKMTVLFTVIRSYKVTEKYRIGYNFLVVEYYSIGMVGNFNTYV